MGRKLYARGELEAKAGPEASITRIALIYYHSANLARVYRKLGISSRAELGARMADERRRAGTQT